MWLPLKRRWTRLLDRVVADRGWPGSDFWPGARRFNLSEEEDVVGCCCDGSRGLRCGPEVPPWSGKCAEEGDEAAVAATPAPASEKDDLLEGFMVSLEREGTAPASEPLAEAAELGATPRVDAKEAREDIERRLSTSDTDDLGVMLGSGS